MVNNEEKDMNLRWSGLVIILAGLFMTGCATHPDNPAFPLSSKQAGMAIDEMRQHPKPLDRPLVIVGGFLDPDLFPPLLEHYFKSISPDAKIVTVTVGFYGSFEDCRQAVISAVDKEFPSSDPQWTTQVDVVGVSLGGLVARYAAAPCRDASHLSAGSIWRGSSRSAARYPARRWRSRRGLPNFYGICRSGPIFKKYLAAHDAEARY